MDHAVENLRDLLVAWGLDPGDPPEDTPAQPDLRVDNYLLDSSRRLALAISGRDRSDEAGSYVHDELEDVEAEELARALRLLVDVIDREQHLNEHARSVLIDAVTVQAMDEWQQGDTFDLDAPVRHQTIESSLREALTRLGR